MGRRRSGGGGVECSMLAEALQAESSAFCSTQQDAGVRAHGGGSSTFTPGSAYCRHTELTLAFSSTLSVSVAQAAWLEPGWAPKSERRLMQERPPRAGPSVPPAASQAAALVTAAGGVRPGRPAAPPSLQATRIPPARRPELFWRACRMQQTTALTARLCRPLLCHRPAGRRLCRSAAAATTTPQASRPGCIPA